MKSFFEAIDLPFEEPCDTVRPELKHEIDIGDGAGGLNTILNLIYFALILQEEAALAQGEQHKKKSKRKGSLVKKDISELQKYEEQNTEYVDVD